MKDKKDDVTYQLRELLRGAYAAGKGGFIPPEIEATTVATLASVTVAMLFLADSAKLVGIDVEHGLMFGFSRQDFERIHSSLMELMEEKTNREMN